MQTQQTEYMFDSVESAPKPTLVNVGEVSEVLDGYVSKSERYVVQPIKIRAFDSGYNTTVFLLYRPEWFVKGFKVTTLEETEGYGKGAHWVYRRNIASDDELSYLRGLAGSDAAFNKLAGALFSLPVNKDGVHSIEDVTEVIRKHFTDNGVKVGYILQQGSVKTDQVDEDGKNIYRLENRYVLAQKNPFFDATEKNILKFGNKAERSEGKTVMTYGGPY